MYELGQLRDDPANLAMEYPCNDVPDSFRPRYTSQKKLAHGLKKYTFLSLSLHRPKKSLKKYTLGPLVLPHT